MTLCFSDFGCSAERYSYFLGLLKQQVNTKQEKEVTKA
jgi:hypothetical protein